MKINLTFYTFLVGMLFLIIAFSCKKNPPSVIPTIKTSEVAKITPTTANCGGEVVAEGDAFVTARGVCWSLQPNPALEDYKTIDGTGIGNFTSSITGLKSELTYYVRAYATNAAGTVYGEQKVFITPPIDPKVTKPVISYVTPHTATVNVNIKYYDISQIDKYGICWSTNIDPYPNNPNVNTIYFHSSSDTTSVDYTYKMLQLPLNTTFYIRAFVAKTVGPTYYYGDVNTFTTVDNNGPNVTDIDGNVYHSVTIGSQAWMVENLKVKHYRNGDAIPYVSDYNQWATSISGALFYETYLNQSSLDALGGLYNWYAINDSRKIAPMGWHVPSNAEWQSLLDFLGGSSSAGIKLKEAGFAHWSIPNSHWTPNLPDATNEWGFTALPGGKVFDNGRIIIANGGLYGYWWMADENNATTGLNFSLGFDYISSFINIIDKSEGLSVRCIKD